MLQGPRPGDPRSQIMTDGSNYSVQRPGVVRSQSYTHVAPRVSQPYVHGSSSEGHLDSHQGVLLPPNMLMSMMQGQMQAGMSQISANMPQMSQKSANMPQMSQISANMPQMSQMSANMPQMPANTHQMPQMSSNIPQIPANMHQMLQLSANVQQIPGGLPVPNMGEFGDMNGSYNMLMAPSPGASMDSPLPKSGINLMNIDISQSNFLKAMNFETLSNRATGSGDNGHRVDDVREEDDVYSECSQSEDGDYMEQNMASETTADLIEHQQAKAQAQLLGRFKQLRQWQTSQQEMLVRQQQEQLAQLREEQTRVQRIIVKQRENQWGANGIAPTLPKTSTSSPPRPMHNKPPLPPHSLVPQTMAQGALSLARINRNNQPEPIPQPTTPQKGRPVPNITSGPSTPLEYLEHGNPALDSDNNTLASGTPLEDGIQRLADTASECSEAPCNGPAYFHSKSKPQMPEEERQKRANSVKKYGSPIPFPQEVEQEQEIMSKLGSLPLNMVGTQQHQITQNPMVLPPLQDQARPMFVHNNLPMFQHNMVTQQQNPHMISNFRHIAPPGGQLENLENNVLDFRDVDYAMVNGEVKDYDVQSMGSSEGFQIMEDNYLHEEIINQSDEAEDQSEAQEQEDNDLSENQSLTDDGQPIDPDDQPVTVAQKTFEQLLEEELQKEEARLREADTQANSANSSQKKSFLKRGEGIARFDSHIRRPPPKKPASAHVLKHSQQSKLVHTAKVPDGPPKNASTSHNNNKKGQVQTRKPPMSSKASIQSKLSHKMPPARKSVSPQKLVTATDLKQPQSNQKKSSSQPKPVSSDCVTKPRDSTGEMSFQKCMLHREEHEEVETEELEEFEILEQYADDNASFLSNVSAVNKVLTEDKKLKPTDPAPAPARTVRSQVSQFTAAPRRQDQLAENDMSSSGDEDHNDTLVGSSPDKTNNQNDNQTQSNGTDNQMAIQRTLQRKVSSMGNRSPQTVKSIKLTRTSDSESDTWEEFEGPNQGRVIHHSDQSESSTEEEDDTESNEDDFNVNDIILNSKLHVKYAPKDNVPQNQASDNARSGGSVSQDSVVAQTSDPSLSHHSALSSQQTYHSPNDFGDDEEWGDIEGQRSSPPKINPAVNGPIIKTKVFTDQNGSGDADGVSTTPPTSKLVTKLFPKLKPEKPKQPPITIQQEQQLTNARQAVLGDGMQSTALRDKLAELEKEIERFRKENMNLEALRREREEGLEHIQKEMDEFQKQKSEELQSLQDFKNEELKKLRKEKRVFEQYQKAARAMPDKREREEIDTLKHQVSDLQDELKRKEQRWTASSTRLRDRIESVERENAELKDEIKILEKKRLEAWQQKEEATTASRREDLHKPIIPPQPQTSQAIQPVHTAHSARDNIIRISYNTDGDNDSEFPDSASQAAAILNITNDESLIMQTAPQAVIQGPGKHLSSSPQHNDTPEPQTRPGGSTSRSSITRKTAVPANISQAVDKGDEKYEEMQHTDGKIERIYSNGAREILFSNGTRKQVSADGHSIIVSFFNGDIKQIMPDQRVIYYYADAQTTHTTYPDGLEIIQFSNNQTEKHYPDGTREITFPDHIIKYLFPTGVEESIFPDGTVIRVERNGDKVMEFPNGQREIHNPQYKKREYPDGTVKTVYPDGRQETRYSSGRIRVKDRDGQIIVDRRI